MGWAIDAFNNSMMRAGAVPLSYGYESENYQSHSKQTQSIQSIAKNEKIHFKKHYDFPTDKQQKALNFITNYTGAWFDGKTKQEAREFISENLEYAIKMKETYD